MFKNKRIFSLCLISVLVSILFIQPSFTQELTPAKKTAIAWIDGSKATYEEIAKYIWENPELSLVEFKSSGKLQEYLVKNGFKVEKGISGMPTAFVATWGSGKPVIGFLAEYDALPGISQKVGKTAREAIIPGAPGHGCGHNLFGLTSVTAAVGTKVAMGKHDIKGTIKVFGTPAEDSLVGKVFMARDGVFDGTDIMISWHPAGYNGVDYSTCCAMTSVKFMFKGVSAHASAAPHAGQSALDGVELMNIAMNYMREHVIQEARISYVITKGGEAPNVVPADAEVWYFIRSPRRTQVDQIWDRMQDVAKGAALMSQTKMSHKLLCATWETLPNKVLSKIGDANAIAIGGPPFTAEDQKFGEEIIKSLGREVKGNAFDTTITSPDLSKTFPNIHIFPHSTDQGNVSWVVPTLSFHTATVAKGSPLHTWQWVCQTGMPSAFKGGLTASKWMGATALDCLTKPEIIFEASKEHKGYLAETKYYHPIPADLKVPTFKDLYGIEPEAVPSSKQ